ncbi:MAG: energy transducer TonB [Deltaproteobacteria bacterium]|nr:energy transducer TonB [Deltaproteobacteria bacterium]
MSPSSLSSFHSSLQVFHRPIHVLVRTGRRSGAAWGASSLAHGVVLAAVLWGSAQVADAPRPLIRFVFAEPPPPPSVSVGASTAPASTSQPEQSPVVVEKPKEQAKAKLQELERLKIVKKKKLLQKPKPQQRELPMPRQPEAISEPVTAPAAVAPPSLATETTTSDDQGVIGGVTNGHAGGIIGGQGTEPLPIDQVANPPLLLSRVMPEYPRQARLQGAEGLVLLEAILDLDGRIEEDIKVLQSIPSLDLVAMRALRRWRFRPARDRGNRPVRVILAVPVRFVLK